MSRSSSWCRISGDGPLPAGKAFLWRLLNRLDNAWRPEAGHPRLRRSRFAPGLDGPLWEKIDRLDAGLSSPARRLVLHFLAQFPWAKAIAHLGPLGVADLGCGRGEAALHLQDFTEGNLQTYQGFDIAPRPEWPALQAKHPFITFRELDSHAVLADLDPACNLILSETSLEHIPDDLALFDQIAAWMRRRQGPLLQLHFLPAAASLELYGLHGFRQYSPRRVVRLLERLPENCRATLVSLGGNASAELHRLWVGPRHDRRGSNPGLYNSSLRQALGRDAPSEAPLFYALLVTGGAPGQSSGSVDQLADDLQFPSDNALQ
ncbi:MAG: hypothetical protein HQL59_10630 [Magnetococcales bacterium]|nr:hypothetical protein [Magnetococcales bacterium]